jgi:hypothetical protein
MCGSTQLHFPEGLTRNVLPEATSRFARTLAGVQYAVGRSHATRHAPTNKKVDHSPQLIDVDWGGVNHCLLSKDYFLSFSPYTRVCLPRLSMHAIGVFFLVGTFTSNEPEIKYS